MSRIAHLALAFAGLLAFGGASNAALLGIEYDGDVVSINETTGVATLLSANPSGGLSNAMARNAAGVLYVSGGAGAAFLNTVNPTTGVVTVGPEVNLGTFESIRALAFSPAGVLYATNLPVPGGFAPPFELFTINTSTGVGTFVASVPAGIQGMAFAPSGVLYGWEPLNTAPGRGLLIIDPATGAVTDVNPAVGADVEIQGLAFSTAGVLYGARGELYTIDLATGVPTLVGNMGVAATDVRGIEFADALPPAPAVSLTPATLAFGNQLVGSTSAAQALTLTNVGTAPLNIASIAASGDFAQTNTCGPTLAPTASCTISVTFTPTAVGARSGAVAVTSNATGSPHTSSLSGTGTAAPPGPSVSLTPNPLVFGAQTVGTASAPQAITLQNTGGSTLNITAIVASGDFAQTNTCGPTLAAAATCTISVTFTPTALGARTGAITVTSNASGSPQTAALSGTGAAAPGPASAEPIPTLSEWALFTLILLVGMLAFANRRRLTLR